MDCCRKKAADLVLICAERSAPLNGYSKRKVHGALCRPPSVSGTAFTDIFAELTKDHIPEEISLDSTFVRTSVHKRLSKV